MNEYPFILPVGLRMPDGQVHRTGSIRLATALDEIEPAGDPRVKRNDGYYGLLLLARVVVRLGSFKTISPELIAMLPAADYAYLQALYASLNNHALNGNLPNNAENPLTMSAPQAANVPTIIETECPHCGAVLELDLSESEE